MFNVIDPEQKEKQEDMKTQVTKKRKATEDVPDMEAVRKEARSYCADPEECQKVSGYSHKKLISFIDEKKFLLERELKLTISAGLHQFLGHSLDAVIRGDGYVRDEIHNDLSLKSSIETELNNFTSFISNRYRILLLTFLDAMNGKKRALLNRNVDESNVSISELESTVDNDHQEGGGGTEEETAEETRVPPT